MTAIGPAQPLVLGSDKPDFHGEVIEELEKLRESDTVRMIDALAVYKDASEIEVMHLSNLTKDEAIEFGRKVAALIGLGIEGEEGMEAAAELGDEQAAEEGIHVSTDEEAWDVPEEIPNDSAAALLLIEHHCAVPLRDAMPAFAGMSAAAGVTQAFPLGASGSRTTVNDEMGARTQIAGLFAAGAVVLLFFTEPVSYLPKAVLGAVIVRRSAQPRDAVLGCVDRLGRRGNVELHPSARVTPGVVVYRLDDRLFFANARYVKGRVREALRGAPDEAHWLVFDADAVSHIDATGLAALHELAVGLPRDGVALVVARMKPQVYERLLAGGVVEEIGEERFFPTVRSAVAACLDVEGPRAGSPA